MGVSASLLLSGQQGRSCALLHACRTCCNKVESTSEWANICQESTLCPEPTLPEPAEPPSPQRRSRRAKDKYGQAWDTSAAQRLEELVKELFTLHDLDGNGFLEEAELIKLNERIAYLHHGKHADLDAVRRKYSGVFRAKLDPRGRPVPYERFRAYAQEVIDGLDPDPEAQEMILEQFVAEAQSGRQAFCDPALVDESDLPFISSRSKMDWNLEALRIAETSREVVMCSNTCETPFSLVRSNSFDAPFWRSCSKAPPDILWL